MVGLRPVVVRCICAVVALHIVIVVAYTVISRNDLRMPAVATVENGNASNVSSSWSAPGPVFLRLAAMMDYGGTTVTPATTTTTTKTTTRETSPDTCDMASFLSESAKRRKTVSEECSRPLPRPTRNFNKLLVMADKGIVWCPVFKASSTSWLHYLLDIADITETRKEFLREKFRGSPLNMVKSVTTKMTSISFGRFERSFGAENVRSFLVVRHPFHRLVSAFRDKLERATGNSTNDSWYFKTYGRKMVATYRKAAIARFGHKFFSAENNFGAPVSVSGGWRSVDLPTFWEFVQYVRASRANRMDEHWQPVYTYCSPCSIHYKHVIHFEQLSSESGCLRQLLDPDHVAHNNNTHWENRTDKTHRTEDEITRLYFNLLSDEDIRGLYAVYERDFKLFGYTFQMNGIVLA